MEYSDEKINKLIEDIYDGVVDAKNLPVDLYKAIANYLKKALYEGFGTSYNAALENLDGSSLELLSELRTNIYMFSAAKTYQQVREMVDLMVKDDKLKTFVEFKSEAKDVYNIYNEDYLKSEYNTALASAQEAENWDRIEREKEVLPYLRYSAVMDANTSEICAPLNNLVAPVNDPIWNTIAPPNHFNCRCLLETLDKEEGSNLETPTSEKNSVVKSVESEMQDVFKMNSGKDAYIFKPDHPYFSVPKEDREYAQNNFNLPIPKKD